MNEPIVFKRSVLVGQFVLAQILVPPLVAIGMLIGLSLFYSVTFDGEFRTLAVLVAILAPTVMRRPRVDSLKILPRSWSIAASVLAPLGPSAGHSDCYRLHDEVVRPIFPSSDPDLGRRDTGALDSREHCAA